MDATLALGRVEWLQYYKDYIWMLWKVTLLWGVTVVLLLLVPLKERTILKGLPLTWMNLFISGREVIKHWLQNYFNGSSQLPKLEQSLSLTLVSHNFDFIIYTILILSARPEHDASEPVNSNDIGYEFINGHASRRPLFDSLSLQRYIILCSQVLDPSANHYLRHPALYTLVSTQ